METKVLRESENNSLEMQYIKPYMYIKGFAAGLELQQTSLALPLARDLHDGQLRKDGTPYICHPLRVCSVLISDGIKDDITLAAALLHDVLEECQDKLPLGGKELISEFGIKQEVIDVVKMLSKKPGLNDEELGEYFHKIATDPRAALVKLSDRLHNIGTVYAFTEPKLQKYIRETKMFILPLASYCKKYYPEYNNAFSSLKSNIETINTAMEIMSHRYTGPRTQGAGGE